MESGNPAKPLLEGLRVLEVATWIAAPAIGTMLAEYGADVTHIEDPARGDPFRVLVTQLWSGEGVVSHSRGFHLPDEGVFFSLDVGIPLVQGTEPPPAAEDETGRDDEWERTKEQVRK